MNLQNIGKISGINFKGNLTMLMSILSQPSELQLMPET